MNFGTHFLVGFNLRHFLVCQCVVSPVLVWNESKTYGVGVSGTLRGMSPDFVLDWGQDIVSVPLTPIYPIYLTYVQNDF